MGASNSTAAPATGDGEENNTPNTAPRPPPPPMVLPGPPRQEHRSMGWLLLAFFSLVALVAHVTRLTNRLRMYNADIKWAASVMAISFALATIAFGLHFGPLREHFVGEVHEGIVAIVLLLLWVASLPNILNPNTTISTGNSSLGLVIINGNVYFASWLALLTCGFLTVSWILHFGPQLAQRRHQRSQRAVRFGRQEGSLMLREYGPWTALCLFSCVAMASSVRAFRIRSCQGNRNPLCGRSKYVLAVAVISAVVTGMWLVLLSTTGQKQNFQATQRRISGGVGAVLAILWCVAVITTTLGSAAPAVAPGNLFYSTWFCFGLSAWLAFDNVAAVLDERKNAQPQSANNDDHNAIKTSPSGEDTHGEESDDDKKAEKKNDVVPEETGVEVDEEKGVDDTQPSKTGGGLLSVFG